MLYIYDEEMRDFPGRRHTCSTFFPGDQLYSSP